MNKPREEKPKVLTIYECDKIASFGELVRKVKEEFGEDFESLSVNFGIVSIEIQKKPAKQFFF